MRPQEVFFAGNWELWNLGIANYFDELGLLGTTHVVSFLTYCEIINNEPGPIGH